VIVGLVLAGGRSRRFGAEKAMALFEGRPLLLHAAERLAGACDRIAVSAGADSGAARLAASLAFARVEDDPRFASGPLNGLLAGLTWAKGEGAELLVTVPCDTPNLPQDLAARLEAGLGEAASAAVARAADGLHPLCGVWRPGAAPVVQAALSGGDHPPVRDVLASLSAAEVWFEDAAAFANVNSPAELPSPNRH
jgi:molybdopterin-guanine dinucleotide biosynthesis protein A